MDKEIRDDLREKAGKLVDLCRAYSEELKQRKTSAEKLIERYRELKSSPKATPP